MGRHEGLALKHRNHLVTAFAGLLFASCADAGPQLAHVFSSEHFEYYIEEGIEPPCPEVLEWLERFYESFSQYLGVELPEGERFVYIKGSTSFVQRECNGADRCHGRGTVYSIYNIDRHELVHAHNWLLGWAPSLFNEGLAEVLGCFQVYLEQELRWTPDDLRLVMTSDAYRMTRHEEPLTTQLKSMSFVRYLLDHFGKEAFVAFYRSFPSVQDHYATEEVIEERFLAAFGEPFDVVAEAWYVSPHREMDELCLYFPECEQFDAMQGNTAEVKLSCGDRGLRTTAAVYGGVQPIVLERDEWLLMQAYADEDVESVAFSLRRCEGGIATAFELGFGFEVGPRRRTGVLRLPAGRYFASFTSRQPATVDFQAISLTRDDASCGVDRDPISLSPDEHLIVYRRWIEDETCNGLDAAPWCPGGVALDIIPSEDGELGLTVDGPSRVEQAYYLCEELCGNVDGELACTEELEIDGQVVGFPLDEPLVRYRWLNEGERVRVAVGPTVRDGYPLDFSNVRITLLPNSDAAATSP